MKELHIRFYEELNDFLPGGKRKKRFLHNFWGNPSVKDIIESLGVPHTEVDLILANGISEKFDYHVKDKDDISVYPVFESFDISELQRLRPSPLRNPKFILDVHLGKLARYMRMFGFDTLYSNKRDDDAIVALSITKKCTILTRDLGILKRSEVTHGYFVRNTNPVQQAREILNRFQLHNKIKYFTRCLVCNEVLVNIDKGLILDQIPEKVKLNCNTFYRCCNCNKIYWKGTHFDKMSKTLKTILE